MRVVLEILGRKLESTGNGHYLDPLIKNGKRNLVIIHFPWHYLGIKLLAPENVTVAWTGIVEVIVHDCGWDGFLKQPGTRNNQTLWYDHDYTMLCVNVTAVFHITQL